MAGARVLLSTMIDDAVWSYGDLTAVYGRSRRPRSPVMSTKKRIAGFSTARRRLVRSLRRMICRSVLRALSWVRAAARSRFGELSP